MITFKVGDKVRRINRPYDQHMQVGTVGIVTAVNYDGSWISVDHHTYGEDIYPYMSVHFELVDLEENTVQQYKYMKIRIKNKEHSRLVQETLFTMGYFWSVDTEQKCVRDFDEKFLFTSDRGYISWGRATYYFEDKKVEEVELVTTYFLKTVDQEAKRKKLEKAALETMISVLQEQLNEAKQKLESL